MREKYNRGEFEARNRQLPADLNQTVAYNASARARAEFDQTPVGTPPSCYDVRSVYDSRPINCYDFHITQFRTFTSVDTTLRVEMSVPEGYAAALRGVEIWFEPAPIGANRSDVSAQLQLNGGDYPNNSLLIGIATDGLVPMFMLADEFNRIGIKIGMAPLVSDIGIGVHFYGNFILKTERALPFEIANPVNDPLCKPTVKSRVVPQFDAPTSTVPAPTPAAPTLTAPAPIPVAPPARPSAPPYPINWRMDGMGNNKKLIPIQNDRGQRRDLSRSEIVQYFDFLNAQKMNAKEREAWNVYTRSLGV